ncbi:MAG: right-handed parallel beta-helix repeat-containing protein, partial [Myxococcota bacterium]
METTLTSTCYRMTTVVGADDNSDGRLAEGEIDSRESVCVPVTTIPDELVRLPERFVDPMEEDLRIEVRSDAVEEDKPNAFPTLQAALDSLRTRRKSGPVVIEITDQTLTRLPEVVFDDLDGLSIVLTGSPGTKPVLEFMGDGFRIPSGYDFGTIRGLELRTESGDSRGIRVESGARVALEDVEIRGFKFGLEVIGGHVEGQSVVGDDDIPLQPSVIVDCERRNDTSFSAGVWARENAAVQLQNSSAAGCIFGFWAVKGSTLNANGSTAEDNHSNGFRAEKGAVMQLDATTVRNNGFGPGSAIDSRSGYHAREGGVISAERWIVPGGNNGDADIEILSGSSMSVLGAGPENCGVLRCDPTAVIIGCRNVTCSLPHPSS